jgi:hypothetical protein
VVIRKGSRCIEGGAYYKNARLRPGILVLCVMNIQAVIASEAKQSSLPGAMNWIASS